MTDLDAFWQSIWDHFDLQSPTPHTAVLAEERMPGARWFPGAQVNYTRQVLRHADAAHAAGHPALVFADEAMLARGVLREVSWPQLRRLFPNSPEDELEDAARRGMDVKTAAELVLTQPS